MRSNRIEFIGGPIDGTQRVMGKQADVITIRSATAQFTPVETIYVRRLGETIIPNGCSPFDYAGTYLLKEVT